jgi:hypothetical protein
LPEASPEAFAVAAAEPAVRPRLGLAVGMGLSWDGTGFVDRPQGRVPSFAVVAEARGMSWGGALELLTTSGSGRFPYQDRPVDRVGVDALVTVRPWATGGTALGRELMLAVGPGYEHAAAGASSTGRWGVRAAVSEDLTLWKDPSGSELRLRLTARRFWGTSATLGAETVSDTLLDLGLALAVVF